MFKPKVTREEFIETIKSICLLLGWELTSGETGERLTKIDVDKLPTPQKDFNRLEKKLTDLYDHLGLEYFEEKTSGVREKPDFEYNGGIKVFVKENLKAKKRSKKKKI